MKKVLAFLMAFAMMFQLSGIAYAVGETKQVTVKTDDSRANGGSVSAYRIFDMTKGATSGYEYSLVPEYEEFFNTIQKDGKSIFEGLTADDAKSNAAYSYVMSKTTGSDIQKLANDLKKWISDNSSSIENDTVVTGSFSSATPYLANLELPYGYYLFSFSDTPAVLTNVTENSSSEINLKKTLPTVDKEIVEEEEKGTTASIGDIVSFKITSIVPDTSAYDTYNFRMEDTMSKGLTFIEDSVSVQIGTEILTEVTDYTITGPEDAGNDAKKITITFNDIKSRTVGDTITVTYQAQINENVETVDATADNPNKNTVKVIYSNDPNSAGEGESTPSETKVYSFKLNIDKRAESEAGSALQGAQFVLFREKAGGGREYYYNDETANGGKGEIKWTEVAGDEILKYEDIGSHNITYVTTDVTGTADFKGLKPGTYYLREITAPEGYNKLTGDATKIEITAEIDDNGDLKEWKINGNKQNTLPIVNHSGTELPSTGAMGTAVVTFAGVAAIIFGSIMITMSRKKKARKS